MEGQATMGAPMTGGRKGEVKRPRPSRYLIYGLVDPRNHKLRYIGKTHKRREIRLQEHLIGAQESNDRPLHIWLRELLSIATDAEIFVLERVPGSSSWKEAERRQIAFWKQLPEEYFPVLFPPMTLKSTATRIDGVSLLNRTRGG